MYTVLSWMSSSCLYMCTCLLCHCYNLCYFKHWHDVSDRALSILRRNCPSTYNCIYHLIVHVLYIVFWTFHIYTFQSLFCLFLIVTRAAYRKHMYRVLCMFYMYMRTCKLMYMYSSYCSREFMYFTYAQWSMYWRFFYVYTVHVCCVAMINSPVLIPTVPDAPTISSLEDTSSTELTVNWMVSSTWTHSLSCIPLHPLFPPPSFLTPSPSPPSLPVAHVLVELKKMIVYMYTCTFTCTCMSFSS